VCDSWTVLCAILGECCVRFLGGAACDSWEVLCVIPGGRCMGFLEGAVCDSWVVLSFASPGSFRYRNLPSLGS
jgi:hypothetical protein